MIYLTVFYLGGFVCLLCLALGLNVHADRPAKPQVVTSLLWALGWPLVAGAFAYQAWTVLRKIQWKFTGPTSPTIS